MKRSLGLLFMVSAVLALAMPAAAAAPNVYQLQEGFVDAHGVMIYYVEMGHGSPLLIVHGGPGASHEYFLPWLLPLARTNRLVFIDERGSGRSERVEDVHQYTVENMVEDVEAVRTALGLGKISLLGHSYGGVLAQAYALKYQKNLSHLVLASTFPSTKEMNEVLAHEKSQMPPEKLARIQELEKAGLYDKGALWERRRYSEEYEKLAWGDGYFPFLFGAHPDSNYDPTTDNAGMNWELYREMWGSDGEFVIDGNLKSVEYVDRLPTIKVPTLVICGDHDECDPSLSKEMHEKIAGSKLVILPNSGHLAFEDQPGLWIGNVRDFINAGSKGAALSNR
ncbi:MAG TPA: proline iminopeptidase-family hydrolase [Chthoniobacterales bacterium]